MGRHGNIQVPSLGSDRSMMIFVKQVILLLATNIIVIDKEMVLKHGLPGGMLLHLMLGLVVCYDDIIIVGFALIVMALNGSPKEKENYLYCKQSLVQNKSRKPQNEIRLVCYYFRL